MRCMLVSLIALAPAAALATPFELAHQGRLLDADGGVVSGTRTLTLTVYQDGVQRWQREYADVAVEDGFYALRLDGLDTAWLSGEVELGVAIDGGSELLPRAPLATAPRAAVALAVPTVPVATGACSVGEIVIETSTGEVRGCANGTWGRGILATDGRRTWSDGAFAASCAAYRHPTGGDRYAGDVGDGVYRIDPDGDGTAFDAWCDMETEAWTGLQYCGIG